MAQLVNTVTTMKTENHPVATEPAPNLKDLSDGIQTKAECSSKINEFFRCEPPTFGEDTTEPLVARQWILELENIFDCIGCSREQKVAFACLRLKGSALSWWIMSKRKLKADGVSMTWEKFKELFDNRYFPEWLKYHKFREFCRFRQGERTVAEYDAEFIKLCSLFPEFISDDTSDLTADMFDGGLSWEIGRHIRFVTRKSYPEIRDRALRLERGVSDQDYA